MYERNICSARGISSQCAFPYRPQDNLQAELINCGALAVKSDPRRGTIVLITSDGYSYLMEEERAEQEERRKFRRTIITELIFVLAAALCVAVGFYLGYFVVPH